MCCCAPLLGLLLRAAYLAITAAMIPHPTPAPHRAAQEMRCLRSRCRCHTAAGMPHRFTAHGTSCTSLTAHHQKAACAGARHALYLPAVIAAHLNSRALNAFVFVWCPGYIAVEMAGILNALGTDTTLFCRGARSHVHSQKLAFLQKRGWSFVF